MPWREGGRDRAGGLGKGQGTVRVAGVFVASVPAAALVVSLAHAQQAAEQPVETVGTGTMLGIGLFLLVAALIVVSFACKLLVVFGLVPKKKSSRLRRTILWLANVAGDVRITRGRNDRGGGRSASSGGGGSSGDY